MNNCVDSKTNNWNFLDLTIFYNPKPDYPPVTQQKLLTVAWTRTGNSIERAMLDFDSSAAVGA